MSDTSLHYIYNRVNSKPRYAVQGVVQDFAEANRALAEQHAIQEPESTRDNITSAVFGKMTALEKIQEKSAVSTYLGSTLLQKNAELQSLKTTLKDATHTKDDDMVNDLIGG